MYRVVRGIRRVGPSDVWAGVGLGFGASDSKGQTKRNWQTAKALEIRKKGVWAVLRWS